MELIAWVIFIQVMGFIIFQPIVDCLFGKWYDFQTALLIKIGWLSDPEVEAKKIRERLDKKWKKE